MPAQHRAIREKVPATVETVPGKARKAKSSVAGQFEVRENERGKFLRITEEAHGRRNTIIVPSTGIDDFTAAIAEAVAAGTRLSAIP